MDWRLLAFKGVLAVFTIVLLIVAATTVYSAFLNPLMNEQELIVVPDEDDVRWALEDDDLILETQLWINNTGYYAFKDTDLSVTMEGMGSVLFDESRHIDRIDSGDSKKIPLKMSKDIDTFSEEDLRNFAFNQTDFQVTASLTAEYTMSLLELTFDYDDVIVWTGLVEQLEFLFNDAEVRKDQGDTGSVLEIPIHLDTNNLLSGTATVDIDMWDNSMSELISTESVNVGLGYFQQLTLEFPLDRHETDDFITRSQTVKFVSTIKLTGSSKSFDYTRQYRWGAPLDGLDIDAHVSGGNVTATYSFENESPRYLDIRTVIWAYDSNDDPVGYETISDSVDPGEEYSNSVQLSIIGSVDYLEITFTEINTGMEYEKVVDV
ncbi:MAG: hypothetical protein R6U61_03605 [Thermoplasmata archaeon]